MSHLHMPTLTTTMSAQWSLLRLKWACIKNIQVNNRDQKTLKIRNNPKKVMLKAILNKLSCSEARMMDHLSRRAVPLRFRRSSKMSHLKMKFKESHSFRPWGCQTTLQNKKSKKMTAAKRKSSRWLHKTAMNRLQEKGPRTSTIWHLNQRRKISRSDSLLYGSHLKRMKKNNPNLSK